MPQSPRLLISRHIVPLVFLLAAPAAFAQSGAPFEGTDGNLTAETLADWGNFVASPALNVGTDLESGQNDDSFRGKEDEVAPDVTFGSIPGNKSDLLRFYAIHETAPVAGVDKDFLYIAWTRFNTLGTANMDFEFNQAEAVSANGVTPVRTPGDLLITFAFANGGSTVNLGLARWTESGACESASSAPCWGPIMPLSGFAEGSVNTAPVHDPIAGSDLAEYTFGEAVINLTDAGVFDRDECVSFGNAYIKSRSSDSFTASMKDFISPIDVSVTNCATVIVRKNAVPDDAQDFTFSASATLSPTPFLLDDDGDPALSNSRVFEGKFEGLLEVSEQPTGDWDLTAVDCTGAATPRLDASGDPTGTVDLDTEIGRTIDCTFTNTKRGRILVVQQTNPAGDAQSFEHSLSGQAFSLKDGDPPYDSGTMRPGVYQLASTDAGPWWDLSTASCDDGSPVDAISLDPGETVTCTVLQTKRGEIVIDQRTLPAGDPQQFGFDVSGGPEEFAAGFELADADAQFRSAPLRTGSYAAVQADDGPEWDLTGVSCSDGSASSAISLAPGETVTCTFTNTKRGSILARQVTDPTGDPQLFDFSLGGGPDGVAQLFSLADGDAPHDSGFLRSGVYSIQQTDPGDSWDAVSAICDDGSPVDAVDVSPGESVTCTFVTRKRGTIRVDQVTDPGGDSFLFQFSLTGGPDATTQSFGLRDSDPLHGGGDLRTGVFSISQADPGPEWDLADATCDDGSAVDAVSLSPGETVTCTFTNLRRGTILIDEVTVPAADPNLFDFTLRGGPEPVDQSATLRDTDAPASSGFLRPGAYSIAVGDPGANWDLTSAVCDDGSDPDSLTLDSGETVTCTFTHTKRGKLIIDEATLPANDPQRFDFDLAGGPDALLATFDLADADPAYDGGFVRPGQYVVTQADPGAAWDLTSAVCSNGSPVGTVDLGPGETITCTFTNTRRGAIRVDQITDPANDPQSFEFTLSGGPDGLLDPFELGDADPIRSSALLRPGSFSLVQADPGSAWDLSSAVCSDGSPLGAIGLDPGETITCTFTNIKRGRILVDVSTDPPGDPFVFQYDLEGPFGLADPDPAHDSGLLAPGGYAIGQIDPGPSWELLAADCDDGSSVNAIELDPGETVSCTFTYAKRARITVEKFVVNVGTGSGFDPRTEPFPFSAPWAASFSLTHGETHDSGWVSSNSNYTIQEQPPAHWHTTALCTLPDGSSVNGGASISVTPAAGTQIHCLFTNELRLHPGSSGFWRNWGNHYDDAQMLAILAEAFAGSPVYDGLFDASGDLLAGALAHIDSIYDNGSAPQEQPALRELTSLKLNLAVSTSDDPTISTLQKNDDICESCAIDVSGIPGATELLEAWAPCAVAGSFTVGDVIDVAEAAWTGEMPSYWDFAPLNSTELALLGQLLNDINHGTILPVDPSNYPTSLDCVKLTVPTSTILYPDADGDGHAVAGPHILTCGSTTPEGYAVVANDCDDSDASIYPGAPQLCDGLNNDCADPAWPNVSAMELDGDGDGWPLCSDCDDVDPARSPAANEVCNGIDDNCSGFADDSPAGLDIDGDGRAEACDNCPGVYNPLQRDFDGDLVGSACDNCALASNADQSDIDADGLGDVCDNCADSYDPSGADADGDSVGDVCDNCPSASNLSQIDSDTDNEGDVCDLDDGILLAFGVAGDMLEWQAEWGFDSFNFYKGDLGVLRTTGDYVQNPGSNESARQELDMVQTWILDPDSPSGGNCAFFLVGGMSGNQDDGIGRTSEGMERGDVP